jgi:hypothetical protein
MMRFNPRNADKHDLEGVVPNVYVSGSVGKDLVLREVWDSCFLLKEHKETIEYCLNEIWDDISGHIGTLIIKNPMETAIFLRIDFGGSEEGIVINYFDILSVKLERLEAENNDINRQICIFIGYFFVFYALILGSAIWFTVTKN